MRELTLVIAAALVVPLFAMPVFGHAKSLPPAFGKELVPDGKAQEGGEPKGVDLEEQQEGGKGPRGSGLPPRASRGQKLHIELDGDEDGGDDGSDGDDGGGDF